MNEHIERYGGQEMFSRELGYAIFGGAIGIVSGGIGGIYLGEALNDYVDVLRESSRVVQYGLDVLTASAGVALGGVIGKNLGRVVGILRS